MKKPRAYTLKFGAVYPLYVAKAERKGRAEAEVLEVIRWLTGYDRAALEAQIAKGADMETFFIDAPALHPNRTRITGVVCGHRVEEIEDPVMQNIRCLDKLVDELAKGRPMEKILRSSPEATTGGGEA